MLHVTTCNTTCVHMGVGDVPFLQVASRPKPSVMPWSEGKTPTERGSKADPEPHDWLLAIDEGKPQLTSSYLQIRLEIHLFPSISRLRQCQFYGDGSRFICPVSSMLFLFSKKRWVWICSMLLWFPADWAR